METMMLTEQALRDRKWEWLPALRPILEFKRVPDRYYGPTSVSDNIFDRVHRLIEISILIQENQAEIAEQLRADGHERIREDLYRVHEAIRYTEDCLFKQAKDQIDKLMHSSP